MRIITFIIMLLLATSAHAGVVEYTNKAAWQNAVSSYQTLDFTGLPPGLPILGLYQEQYGVTFAPGSQTHHSSSMLNDGQGVRGQPGSRMFFDTPQKWIAVDHPGNIVFNLYFQGALIYTSNEFWGTGGFAGLISDMHFDEVYLYRITAPGLVFYDDLYFGVPAPGALGVFALAAFGCRRRRR
ncbi:MAG TPA: hypothetical protein PK400_05605 [Phycisphaerales bacterium]|nr:hypothetical protein [Phycisphaerales bacterium]HRQ75091.1 hypothetical protein [Phycisphaerales bacterium]